MKHIDTREYIAMLRELINVGKDVNLTVTGSSMSPFLIHERDTVFLRKPDHELKKGDIVFYERDSGQFVLHQILRVNRDNLMTLSAITRKSWKQGSEEIKSSPMCSR